MRTDRHPDHAAGRSRPLLRLVRRLGPLRWQAAGAYGAMLAASAIALVVPLAVRDIVDAAIGERPDALGFLPDGLTERQQLLTGAGLVVALALVRAVVSFWQRYGTAWVGRTIATDLRRDLMAHLLDREQAFHDRASVGQLMTRITDDTEQVRAFAATGVADLANIFALLIGTSTLLWSIDPVLAPIALGAVPIVAALAVLGARMLLPRFLELQQARGGLSARLQETLTHVRIFQARHAAASPARVGSPGPPGPPTTDRLSAEPSAYVSMGGLEDRRDVVVPEPSHAGTSGCYVRRAREGGHARRAAHPVPRPDQAVGHPLRRC